MEKIYEEKNEIVEEDLKYIYNSLSKEELIKFKDSTILITGCAGFLGYYFLKFLCRFKKELSIKRIIGSDIFLIRTPEWINDIKDIDGVDIVRFDVAKDKVENVCNSFTVDYVLHMASIASPHFYRKYPIETFDANVLGLRNLFEYFKDKKLKGFLFFSTSEIYGDPNRDNIPTKEEYRGNVSSIGPRACYDESKRIGETMCYLYAKKYDFPVTFVRPFNNYGPGMSIDDKRVPADFAKAIFNGEDINILSDGKPTRTFCYISDAITGYFKSILYGKFEYFNIGIDKPEISILDVAKIYREAGKDIFDYKGEVKFKKSKDEDYLTHNPNRRCPVIDKAKNVILYNPTIEVDEGVRRFLKFVKINGGKL